MEPKIRQIRRWIVEGGHDVDLEVDGGIGPADGGRRGARPGPTCWSPGSALFRDPDGLGHATTEIRNIGEQAARR